MNAGPIAKDAGAGAKDRSLSPAAGLVFGKLVVWAGMAGLLALSAWCPWIGTVLVYGTLAGGLVLFWQAWGRMDGE